MAAPSKLQISVLDNSRKDPNLNSDTPSTTANKEHWANPEGSSFINPWPSWRFATKWERFKLIGTGLSMSFAAPDSQRVSTELPIRTPTWGSGQQASTEIQKKEQVKATWLGHACFLVEFPSRAAAAADGDATDGRTAQRGLRILFDPVFSDRCSPSQLVGPKRFTPPPCKIEEIPHIDAIVISHDHYDHLDTHTIRTLANSPSFPHIFAGLGNGPFFESLGIPKSRTHIMDWWESKRLEVSENGRVVGTVDITCTPAQHFSGRSFSAYYTTLWASWSVEEVVPAAQAEQPERRDAVKLFFGGDTGYRSVMDHQKEDEVPVCPAFKEIGNVFGGFDLALIPIGAYLPRQFMSPIHCAPQDSVKLFKDIKAKKAIGMHWGTWVLTTEDVLEPPKRLKEECRKAGIDEDDFRVCDIGQTLCF
ncbi:N-acyl-phosphatidylethanolamine-hydrolyzing phospholipase D [Coprinopsis marcescibilis]|uniref:N-acyl-phosphatidylethanolamine-hydrolyzing phospholipase D n=1 Tax=Coprinopsis marcescibilis TaxID=230819 RepID=A0A5C3KTQ2_COPMA|nr:N-acyl-phosphatidylethanolamine-hydrolyzing phospholipase D [Coprinopsis marcescibilis]